MPGPWLGAVGRRLVGFGLRMAVQILVARTREESRDMHPAASCAVGIAAVVGVLPAMTALLAASLALAAVFGPLGAGVAGIDHGSPGWRQPVESDSLIIGEEIPQDLAVAGGWAHDHALRRLHGRHVSSLGHRYRSSTRHAGAGCR